MKRPVVFGDGPFRRNAPWLLNEKDRHRERARHFFTGASLALSSAIVALPVWLFLVHEPHFPYALSIGMTALAVAGIALAVGIINLVRCMSERPFDLLTALSFGVLLVVFVLLVYAGVFAFAIRSEYPAGGVPHTWPR